MFGLLLYAIWGRQQWALALVPLAAPAMLAGAWLGKRISSILEHPSALAAKALVLMAVVVLLLTRTLDLYMPAHTP